MKNKKFNYEEKKALTRLKELAKKIHYYLYKRISNLINRYFFLLIENKILPYVIYDESIYKYI